MSTCTHIWTWLSAARGETLLARHPQIVIATSRERLYIHM